MSAPTWVLERDEELADITRNAHRLMVGKTVEQVVAASHSAACDATNVLHVRFSDGSEVKIVGGYGGYTGNSCDEYVELVDVCEVTA